MSTTTALASPTALQRIHRNVALDEDGLRRVRTMAVIGLIALNIADLYLTRQLLGMGGVEANPLMALVIHGTWGIVIKVGLPVLLAFRHLRAPIERKIVLGLSWMCVMYLGVVLWNLHLFDNASLLQ